MKKVITYGTYDLLHQGHINVLKRAKALGDYLIVGVTSDVFDKERGKLNVRHSVLERIESIRKTGIADEIIIEEYIGQKIDDIQKFEVDIFALGSDWENQFDYLKEFCQVVYLPRTEGISSTKLRNESEIYYRLGVVGTGRIAKRFMPEVEYIEGVNVHAVYNPDIEKSKSFQETFGLPNSCSSFSDFLLQVDAVYIASPHLSHYEYIKESLLNGKHVLCEIPLVLKLDQSEELYDLANKNNLVLMEACKTAFFPAFGHLINHLRSGVIGDIVSIDASLSKLVYDNSLRELDVEQAGGSITELASIPLMAIVKILGVKYNEALFYSKMDRNVDIFTKGVFMFDKAIASINIGLGVKTEGCLVVSGTKGYVFVPSPWWLTDYFEVRFEDQNKNKKYFYPYEGEGLRYELQEFISCMKNKRKSSYKLRQNETKAVVGIIERYRKMLNVSFID